MQEIFEENKSTVLQGAIIWTPMLATDNLTAATKRETKFTDSRVRHFWDPDRTSGRVLAQTLNLKTSIAWDVYLLYPPEHDWDAELPPVPEYWMHQLDEEPTYYLDPDCLKQNSKKFIDKFSG
ncbi:MAG: hypothetical protein HYU84_05285 [Chloroflexi bacterium]|nr:hypothetical protein [Chloroflexota bacterium]